MLVFVGMRAGRLEAEVGAGDALRERPSSPGDGVDWRAVMVELPVASSVMVELQVVRSCAASPWGALRTR